MVYYLNYLFSAIFVILLFIFPIAFEYIFYKKNKVNTKEKFWKQFFQKYGLAKFRYSYLLWGFLLSLGIFALNIIFVTLSSIFFPQSISSVTTGLAKEFLISPIFFSIFLLVSAIAEEFFFRAFLTSYIGIFFATVIFALMHYSYGSVLEIVGAFILGLVFAIIWKKTNNFYIIAIAHFLQNLCSILLLLKGF